jgi:hypothetical protein
MTAARRVLVAITIAVALTACGSTNGKTGTATPTTHTCPKGSYPLDGHCPPMTGSPPMAPIPPSGHCSDYGSGWYYQPEGGCAQRGRADAATITTTTQPWTCTTMGPDSIHGSFRCVSPDGTEITEGSGWPNEAKPVPKSGNCKEYGADWNYEPEGECVLNGSVRYATTTTVP